MPKGHVDAAQIGTGEQGHQGASVGEVQNRFLYQIRLDAPHVLDALRALDGSERAMRAWAARWRLEDEWILNVARRTLQNWNVYPPIAGAFQWASAIEAAGLVPEPPAAIRWEPTLESEAEFLARVERNYLPEVRRWTTSIGLTDGPQELNLARDVGALVQYQVKGEGIEAVAEVYFGGAGKVDAALEALTNVAQLIGVTLRTERLA